MTTKTNQIRTINPRWFAAAAALTFISTSAAVPTLACPTCESTYKPGTYTGEAKRVGNGVAYSWVTLDAKGKPAAIGITLSETALEGLPQNPPSDLRDMARDMFMLMLPKEAMKTAFDHVSLDWVAKGHEPMGVYDKPHFDIHFYTVAAAARQKITAMGADIATCRKPVPAGFSPAGYVYATGTEVPMMGGHWVDPKAPELNGKLFTKTFLYGSYNGDMVFYEPMITKAFLDTKPTLDEAIALPTTYTKSAYYPTRYTVRYDAVRREYTIALEGMAWREAADKSLADKTNVTKTPGVKAAPAQVATNKAAKPVAARR